MSSSMKRERRSPVDDEYTPNAKKKTRTPAEATLQGELQRSVCTAKVTRGHLKPPSVCYGCSTKQQEINDDDDDPEFTNGTGGGVNCRFKDFRLLGANTTQFAHDIGPEPPCPKFKTAFRPQPSKAAVDDLLIKLIPHVEKKIEDAHRFEQQANLIRRRLCPNSSFQCDLCKISLFFSSYFCIDCGYEICPECEAGELPYHPKKRALDQYYKCSAKSGAAHAYHPLSRLPRDTVDMVARKIANLRLTNSIIASESHTHLFRDLFHYANSIRKVPRLGLESPVEFSLLWAHRVPIIIQGVDLGAGWSPDFLLRDDRTVDVTVVDPSGEPSSENMALAEFIELFKKPSASHNGWAYKLKDYPPNDALENELADSCSNFQFNVPAHHLTAKQGLCNLVAHWNGPYPPDLGPKMYMATCDTGNFGSTCLHVDATSTVNVMTYSGENGGAVWLIFKPSDASELAQWLRKENKDAEPGDIIHQQRVFITNSMEERLFKDTGICGFRFTQHKGDAVFIPAGAPHQVSNQAPCIKVAADFCSIECLDATLEVWELWRKHGHKDLMQPTAMLWYAWNSLINLSELAANSGVTILRAANSGVTISRAAVKTTEDRRARRSEKRHSRAVRKIEKQLQCPHEDCKKERLYDEFGLRCHIRDAHRIAQAIPREILLCGSRDDMTQRFAAWRRDLNIL